MADQTEMRYRISIMEDQLKQLATFMQLLTTQIQSLRMDSTPTQIVTKQANKAQMGDDNMSELEDDPLLVTAEKVKPDNVPKTEQDERFAKLEEKVRQLQESQSSFLFDLLVYEKVKVPKKFKMPESEKYDGTSCSKAHLQMYIAPSREDLERMKKKRSESFKEYAVRWRNLAAQITPEPTDKELIKLFVKILPFEFRNRMVSTYFENFSQVVPVGEQIEMGIREGRFIEPSNQRFSTKKKKDLEAEINVTYSQLNRDTSNRTPSIKISTKQQGGGHQFFGRRHNIRRQFTPLPGPLSKVLLVLQKKGLLFTEPKRPNPEHYSTYNPSQKCDYHMKEVGHSTDDCYVLKHRVQDLLDTKAFSFSSNQNLPNHDGGTNAITE